MDIHSLDICCVKMCCCKVLAFNPFLCCIRCSRYSKVLSGQNYILDLRGYSPLIHAKAPTDLSETVLLLLAYSGRLKMRFYCACAFRFRCLLLNGRDTDYSSGLRHTGRAAKTQRRAELRQATGSTKNSCVSVFGFVCMVLSFAFALP